MDILYFVIHWNGINVALDAFSHIHQISPAKISDLQAHTVCRNVSPWETYAPLRIMVASGWQKYHLGVLSIVLIISIMLVAIILVTITVMLRLLN